MKTQTLLRSIFGTAIIALLLLMVSCDAANNPSALVGRWVGVSGSLSGYFDDEGGVIELLSDGTGVLTPKSRGSGAAITWKTENGRFYITYNGGAKSASYKLQGSVLTFTDDNGEITKYTKCKKDCEEAAEEYAKAEAKAEAEKAKAEAKAKAEKAAPALKAKATKGSFTDSRDGKTYKTVKLDNQTWMAENLNFNASGSKCYGEGGRALTSWDEKTGIFKDTTTLSKNEIQANCNKYGRLYNWSAAKSACPSSGWHLPSNAEWQTLVDFVGGDKVAGIMLKASSGWNKDGNGMDAVGFAALPGGNGDSADGNFYGVGYGGSWWSATENGANGGAYGRYMDDFGEVVNRDNYTKDLNLFSVRCLQD